MRSALVGVLALSLVAPVAVAIPQDDGGEAVPAAVLPTVPKVDLGKDFTADHRSNDALLKGLDRMKAVAVIYRDAPSITDSISMEIASPMGSQNQDLTLAFGPKGAARFGLGGEAEIIAVDGKVNLLVSSLSKDKFLQVDMEGDPIASLASVVPGMSLPVPHVALRYQPEFREKEVFGLGLMEEPELAGYRAEGDKEMFLFEDDGAMLLVQVNKAGLIDSMKATMTPPGLPEGMDFSMNLTFTMKPAIVEALVPPIAFDAAGRTAVKSMEELEPQPVKVGDMAPGFDLKDLGGAEFSLASLKGNVVVLDFWATWCGPCRQGLPKIQELASWAEGKPVKVFAVNVWEQGSPDERMTKVKEFWTTQKFTFPTLIDADNAVVGEYGFTGIPATVVIGPDGTIKGVHVGFSPDLADTLKKDIEAAMSSQG